MEFSHDLALQLSLSAEPFPIDFDLAWQWVGYTRHDSAKKKLIRNFEEGSDFSATWRKTSTKGRPSENIHLTIDCFKSLAMMAGTEKGKEVRRYFLECERIAKQAQQVIPAQADKIRELELHLILAQTQERLLLTTSAIATLHGSDMVALILGKPDAVITKTEVVQQTVTVNEKGQVVGEYDGVGITYLAKKYGFGKGVKANEKCRAWLSSIGVKDDQWIEEPVAHTARKLPREMLSFLDQQFASHRGTRQQLIGELS